MNFQQVEQANGNNIIMFGTITEFVGEGINPASQKAWKKAKITDDTGKVHQVTLRGTLPTVALIGQRAQFSIGTYQGTYQGQPYTGYSGFWNDKAQIAPPRPPEGVSVAAESTNDQREMRIVRRNALNAVMSATDIPLDMVKNYLLTSVQFILTGDWKLNPPSYRKDEPIVNEPEPDAPDENW